jgi:hypothetical protein
MSEILLHVSWEKQEKVISFFKVVIFVLFLIDQSKGIRR